MNRRGLFTILLTLNLTGFMSSIGGFAYFMSAISAPSNGSQALNSCSKVLQCSNCYECELNSDQVRCCDAPCGESSVCPTSVMSKASYKRLKFARRNYWPLAVLSVVAILVFAALVFATPDTAEYLYQRHLTNESAPLLPQPRMSSQFHTAALPLP